MGLKRNDLFTGNLCAQEKIFACHLRIFGTLIHRICVARAARARPESCPTASWRSSAIEMWRRRPVGTIRWNRKVRNNEQCAPGIHALLRAEARAKQARFATSRGREGGGGTMVEFGRQRAILLHTSPPRCARPREVANLDYFGAASIRTRWSLSGSFIVSARPFPESFSSSISPPCSRTMRRTMSRPRPLPAALVVK